MGGGFWGSSGGGLALVAAFIYTMPFDRRCIPARSIARRFNALGILASCALRPAGAYAISMRCRIDEEDHTET